MTFQKIQNRSEAEISEVAIEFCNRFGFETREVCKRMVETFAPVLLYIFESHPEDTAYEYCGVVFQDSNCGDPRAPKFDLYVDIKGSPLVEVSDLSVLRIEKTFIYRITKDRVRIVGIT